MRTTQAVPRGLARLLTNSRPARLTAGGIALAVVAAGSLVWATPASAAVPTFPDNIVTFPDRDFVSIEGYEADAGKTMTVTATRAGQVIGKAQGTIAAGGVALEVNHPGGVCWGTGAGAPNITPDLRAGDVITISVDGTEVGDSTSIDAAVGATAAGPAVALDATDKTVLRIRGHVGPGVNTAQLEQRIIAPDLRPLIGRRDVRAVPGPRTTEPRGQYDSALEFTATPDGGSDFVATYWFAPTDPSVSAQEVAALAAAGGVRIMGWLVEDLDANRQGLTISEFGEPGGPGFGGCPNGPALSGPPAPVVQSLVRTSSGTGSDNYVFTWTPAVAVPGTPAITGYRVRAVVVADSGVVLPEQAEFGKRVNSAAATGTTLSLDNPATGTHYEFEISSVNALGNETVPPVNVPVTPPDITGPVVATSPLAALGPFLTPINVTLSSESGAALYYALSDVLDTPPALGSGGDVTPAAIPYTGPIPLAADKRVSVIGIDAAGNLGDQTDSVYLFGSALAPSAPTLLTAAGQEGQAVLTWSPVADPADAPVQQYVVDWSGPGGTTGSTTASASATTATVSGLGAGTYTFTVSARNAVGTGTASNALSADVTEKLVANAGADVTANRGGAAVTLNATGTAGATYTWTQVTSEAGTTEIAGTQLLSSTSVLTPKVTVPALVLPNGSLAQSVVSSRNAPLYFKLTVTKGTSLPRTDVVKVNVATDSVSIATARYRAGQELRITGSASNPAATVKIYRKVQSVSVSTYTYVGTATLVPVVGGTGATYDFRQRPPAFNLAAGEQFYAFSTLGGSSGAFTPTIG